MSHVAAGTQGRTLRRSRCGQHTTRHFLGLVLLISVVGSLGLSGQASLYTFVLESYLFDYYLVELHRDLPEQPMEKMQADSPAEYQ